MINLFKQVFHKLVELFSNKRFLRFLTLYFIFGGKKRRFFCRDVRFDNFIIDVPDIQSFIWQYKDIFVNEDYRFFANTETPIIYDCGANIGISVLYFKQLYPRSVIHAYEADRHIFSCLTKNLTRNGLINEVLLTNKAVWINNEGVDFISDGADGGAISTSEDRSAKTRIPSIRLRDILEKEQHIDMLKIDIEGAEVDVLVDSEAYLGRVKNLFVEYHGWKSCPQRLSVLLAIMEKNGFRYSIHSLSKVKHPLSAAARDRTCDLQLNIYCYR